MTTTTTTREVITVDRTLLLNERGSVVKTLTTDDVAKLRAANTKITGCYFLHNPLTDLVKIGRSLETQGGVLLHPLALWQTKDHTQREAALHQKFAEHRQLGEWFHAAGILPWFHAKRWEPFHEQFDPLNLTPEEMTAIISEYRSRHSYRESEDEW